ncbi:MAG: tRNA 2-thiouridine(34) synthase MnmA [Candidatus Paceibacterota bacterium]|jgi:tRNA-specific 2-thiouridylase
MSKITETMRFFLKKNKKKTREKVLVALSGGVDSSVAALLLQREGYDVSAGFIRGYNVDGCQDRDLEDARAVAQKIGIPFYVFDFEKEYKERVVDYMLDGYRNGTTPNPDVMCNREVKFGLLYDEAMRSGFSWVASGHYARIRRTRAGKFVGIYAARDHEKDQTYFLWDVPSDRFEKILFPLGAIKKPHVRAIARDAQLPTADKKDSQGVCFLGKFQFDEFLKKHIVTTPGAIYDTTGKNVGTHDGAALYTIGQKHGFTNTAGRAYTVIKKDLSANTLTVVYDDDPRLYTKEISIVRENIIDQKTAQKLLAGKTVSAWGRTRYRQPLMPARIARDRQGMLRLIFRHPEKAFPASGQSAVLYGRWGKMLGGGIIG